MILNVNYAVEKPRKFMKLEEMSSGNVRNTTIVKQVRNGVNEVRNVDAPVFMVPKPKNLAQSFLDYIIA